MGPYSSTALVFLLVWVTGCQSPSSSPDTSKSSPKAIISFVIQTPLVSGVISETNHTIAVSVPLGTNLQSLTPLIVQTGTSVSPPSGVAKDFSSPIKYTVLADDGTSQGYLVTVTSTASNTGTNGTLASKARFAVDTKLLFASLATKSTIRSDSQGNILVIANCAKGSYSLGNGTSVVCTGSQQNPVIAKFDPTGKALWVRTVSDGRSTPISLGQFNSLAVDSSDNVIVCGNAGESRTTYNVPNVFNFGNGVTLTDQPSHGPLLVKYSSSGTALWAVSTTQSIYSPQAGSYVSYNDVAVDHAGSIVVGGNMSYDFPTSTTQFGNNLNASLASTASAANLLVKYNSSGVPLWIKTVASIRGYDDNYSKVAVDQNNNIYAVGSVSESSGVNSRFGNGINVAGIAFAQGVLVKYDVNGNAAWANAYGSSLVFTGITVDPTGNPVLVGTATVNQGSPILLGNGVALRYDSVNNGTFLVKFSPAGPAQWATNEGAIFDALVADPNGNYYVAGRTYLNSVSLSNNVPIEPQSISLQKDSLLLAKYNQDGVAQWAESASSSGYAPFLELSSIAWTPAGNLIVSSSAYNGGYAGPVTTVDFGNDVSMSYTDHDLAVIEYAK